MSTKIIQYIKKIATGSRKIQILALEKQKKSRPPPKMNTKIELLDVFMEKIFDTIICKK